MDALLRALYLSRTGEVSKGTLLRLARRMLIHAALATAGFDFAATNELAKLEEELHQEYMSIK